MHACKNACFNNVHYECIQTLLYKQQTGCISSAQMPLSKGAVHLQELKSKLESWRGDGWLEQCCTSLAEQLRVAQAENTELQQELEALR